MAAKPQKMMGEVFEQAVETLDATVKGGIKMQEEMINWWSEMLDDSGPFQNWNKRASACVAEAIPLCQKNTEECLRLVDQNTRNGLSLMQKTMELCQCGSIAQLQGKTQELWEASMAAARTNAQAVAQANARIMESVLTCARGAGSAAPAAV